MIEPDGIPDVDLGAPLDITGDEAVDKWRGVAAEEVDEPSPGLAGLLRSRSRRLLGSLVRPHVRSLLLAALLIGCNTVAQLSVPLLVAYGIDHGRIVATGSHRELLTSEPRYAAILSQAAEEIGEPDQQDDQVA